MSEVTDGISDLRRIEKDSAQDGVEGSQAGEANEDAAGDLVIEINAVAEVRQVLRVEHRAGIEIKDFDCLLAIGAIPIEAVKSNAVGMVVGEVQFDFEGIAGVPAGGQS